MVITIFSLLFISSVFAEQSWVEVGAFAKYRLSKVAWSENYNISDAHTFKWIVRDISNSEAYVERIHTYSDDRRKSDEILVDLITRDSWLYGIKSEYLGKTVFWIDMEDNPPKRVSLEKVVGNVTREVIVHLEGIGGREVYEVVYDVYPFNLDGENVTLRNKALFDKETGLLLSHYSEASSETSFSSTQMLLLDTSVEEVTQTTVSTTIRPIYAPTLSDNLIGYAIIGGGIAIAGIAIAVALTKRK